MQKLDKATLFELKWRDWLFRPVLRPAGILYEYIGHPLIDAISHAFLIATKPFGLPRFVRKSFKPRFLKKEILTAANVLTLYSFFLFAELVYLIWLFLSEGDEAGAPIYSLSAYFLDLQTADLRTITLLIAEIFFIDLIDGPLARINKAVTALGTLLDHVRDYLTVLVALILLTVLTLRAGEWLILGGEIAFLIGFGVIMGLYSLKFRHSQAHNSARLEFKSLKRYLLEEYQTPLWGRIQFWTMGSALISGLMHYANAAPLFSILFPLAVAVNTAVTYYYVWRLYSEIFSPSPTTPL